MSYQRLCPVVLLALPACVLDKDLGDTVGLTSAAGETDGLEPTGGGEGPNSGGEEPTTGVPTDCPGGQDPFASLWQVEYDPLEWGDFYSGSPRPGRMADGRIVVPGVRFFADNTRTLSLLVTTPDGQPIGHKGGSEDDRAGDVHAFTIGADDGPVVLAEHATDADVNMMKLTRFAADMTPVSQGDLPFLADTTKWPFPPALALDGDVPVVAGVAAGSDSSLVARLAPDTAAPVWQQPLAGPPDMWASHIAIGPTGDIAVGAHADVGVDPEDTLRLWRFDPAGTKLWDRVITVPEYDRLTALHFAPDDQIVTLRGTREPSVSVEMLSVDAATGATRWELTVAAEEDEIDAWAQDMHVDADHFTVPVSRYRGHHDVEVSDRWFEVRTVSFTGELLTVTQLPQVFGVGGTSWTRSVRGRCGELVLLYEYGLPQLAAFAP